MRFVPGQRWQSLTEPELGLGVVEAVEGREVVIAYPARGIVRRYAAAHAPLGRARLSEGQHARGHSGGDAAAREFIVEQVVETGGLLIYRGAGVELHERELDAAVDVASPENRLRTAQVDDPSWFDLRHDALALRESILASPARGFLGGRIQLFDHQLAIAHHVCEKPRVRVLLADEVGLGKTIEALLILNRLLLSGRTLRALVLVPPALVHQWLAEAYLRFDLVLRVIGRDTFGGGTIDLESEEILTELFRHSLFVCPLGAAASEALAGSEWDLVVVDEAHHLQLDSAEFELVARLAEHTPHVVFLSATPDRDGEAGHQRRRELLGPGHVMFRNTRARVPGFPRRVPVAVDLTTGDRERLRLEFLHDLNRDATFEPIRVHEDPRIVWLREFLDAHPTERVLALCEGRAKAIAFAGALAARKRDVARFHGQMSTIERDRQAAWFLAPDGPQVLVSSAIGAEGRNFQIAKHLVLLDLPLEADRLEQRIGRVDRLGQGDEVRIYAPVVQGTPQARLRRWYHEALHVFERPWHGAPALERELGAALVDALLASDEGAIERLIARGRARNAQILAELERGADPQAALAAADFAAAGTVRARLEEVEERRDLERFVVRAFEHSGVDVETIGRRSYVLRARPGRGRPFRGFAGRELGVTFDRAVALAHPERKLLTQDHPMVHDVLDDLLARERGNASIARLPGETPALLLEALFVVEPGEAREPNEAREPSEPSDAHAESTGGVVAPAVVRVVVDASGNERALQAGARERMVAGDPRFVEHPQVRERLPELVAAARSLATERAAREHGRSRGCVRLDALRLIVVG